MRQNGGTRFAAGLVASGSLMLAATGCGSDSKFKNEARPPVPVALTGVITAKAVTVSPDVLPLAAKSGQVDASKDLDTPISLIIANETDQAHSITLTGKSTSGKPIEASVPPIGPSDTAEIQQTLPPGTYQIKAGSEQAIAAGSEIRPATLTIKPNRQTSSGDLTLP
jgi:hypothetical protein